MEEPKNGSEYDVLLVQRGQGDYDHFNIQEEEVGNPKSTLCVLV